VGGQTELVKEVVSEARKQGKKVVVVFVSGKPVTVPGVDLVGENGPGAVVQQFYQGELGGLAIAEVLFGEVNPSGGFVLVFAFIERDLLMARSLFCLFAGKLPVSFPRSTGTTPAFYDYLKGARPVDAGRILADGTIVFGHQVRVLPI
jgi:beta-glucosidase